MNNRDNNAVLKVGDTVNWQRSLSSSVTVSVKVKTIEITEGEKHGESVDSVSWSLVRDREVCLDLDNGHWAYGSRIFKTQL